MIEPLNYDEVAQAFHPENINPQPSVPICVYLFSHAAADEEIPTQDLPWEKHKEAIGQFEETLENIDSLGWIERDSDTISLTLLGLKVAGPLYSRVQEEVAMNRISQKMEERDYSEINPEDYTK